MARRGGGYGGGSRGGYGGSLGGRSGAGRSLGGSAPRRAGGGSAPRPSAPRVGGGSFGSGGLGGGNRGGSGLGGSFGRGVASGVGFQMGRNLMGGGRRHRRGGFGGPPHGGGGSSSGCGAFLFIIIIIILILWLTTGNPLGTTLNFNDGPNQLVTQTTRVRERLPAGLANANTPFFTDRLGWIQNQTVMNSGLQYFFDSTGVRPHVYLFGELDGSTELPSLARLESFANELYDELFNDEAHLLFVLFYVFDEQTEEGSGRMFALPGSAANVLMDLEAINILHDYIAHFYEVPNLSNEAFLSNSFRAAATRIMYVPHNPWPMVITFVVAVIGLIIILIVSKNWWKRKKEQANLEAEQTEKLLNTPLEKFNSHADDLASKYEDD